MMLLRRTITRSALLLSLAAAAVAAWPGGAPAAGAEPGWLTVPGGLPLFDVAGIAPGEGGSATLTVTNPQSFPVKFSIAIVSLADDDNGCNEPERAFGDTTCGSGGGELQFDLHLAFSATGGNHRQIADNTVSEWAAQPAVDPLALAGHETRTYLVGYELPLGSSNVTQSDLVAFQLEMRLDQELDSVLASDPPTALILATPSLPHTGTDMLAIVMVAVAASVSGAGLYRMSVRRRRSS